MNCPRLSKVVSHNGGVGVYWVECKEQDCAWWNDGPQQCSVTNTGQSLQHIAQELHNGLQVLQP